MGKKAVLCSILCISLLYVLFRPTGNVEISTGNLSPAGMASRIISGVLSQTDTFYESLKNRNVPAEAINTIIRHLSDLVDFRRCKPGTRYDIRLSPLGEVVRCSYYLSPVEVYTLKEENGDYSVYKEDIEIEKQIVKFSGQVESSLFESFAESGESDRLVMALADIFASDIDFNTEVQPGDQFTVIFEKYFKGEQFVGYGHILAASYETGLKEYRAYYYADPGKAGAYYDAEGKSLGRHFLRSPMPFSRLTSGFTRRRKHPVLGVYRPHLGVDLAAPTGTPVRATADGAILSRGRRGGNGKQVILGHTGGYKTYYGHLSRFAAGIKRGAKVKQGQVIGFVGSSGLSTGPHLDYRIKEKGAFRNPFSLRFKPKTVLKGPVLERFLAKKEEISTLMAMSAPRYEKRVGICKASQVSFI